MLALAAIYQNWNYTEKIGMAPVLGWHANLWQQSIFFKILEKRKKYFEFMYKMWLGLCLDHYT